jgi:hypothetical protein
MTALLAPRTPREASAKPALKALGKPKSRLSRIPFLLILAGILAAGMVGMLILSTTLQDQAFAVESKQSEANVLASKVSSLETQVAEARSVNSLAGKAEKLGMRPNPYTVPIRLSDGKVLGKAREVTGTEMPTVNYSQNQSTQGAGVRQ